MSISPLALELTEHWRREKFLAEANSARLAKLLPRRRSPGLRWRLARVLLALADWLSTDARRATSTWELSEAPHR